MAGGVFSESWYRIAGQRVALRSATRIRRQFFRGEKWYVIEDPFNNQFFRVRPEAMEFLARLGAHRTVEDVWNECIERDPDHAPGQEDVIRLLAQLYHANLLQYGLPEDSVKLFERYKKRREKETRAKLLGIMFLRIPLWDPDAFLKKALGIVGLLISPLGAVCWLLVVGMALKVVVDNFGGLVDRSQGILSPSNIPLLYLAMVFVKVVHEFGHAFVCRKFGGQVHVMGVMLLIFTPVPYMDATSSWSFRSRWQRALVGAAGMIAEIFLAALAVFVWANTGAGTLNSLAYNMMFVASVSTVLFNINPLLRFDGYYILSDILDIPGLHTRSSLQLKHLCERWLFGVKKSTSPARSRREAGWLAVFGVLSGIYKVVVFTAIILFVADKFLLAGMIMALLCIFSMGVVPLVKLGKYLVRDQRLERQRLRAVGVVVGLVAFLVAVLQFIPMPHHFRAPGVVRAENFAEVSGRSSGMLVEVVAKLGGMVEKGEILVRLEDPEVDTLIAMSLADLEELSARHLRAMHVSGADLSPLAASLESARRRHEQLLVRKAELNVRAPLPGLWTSTDIEELIGRHIPRGTALGYIVDVGSSFRFSAVVSQPDVARLFDQPVGEARVRLRGQAEHELTAGHVRAIPAERDLLPSSALGWMAGGDIAVDTSDALGRSAVEPFFEVFAQLSTVDKVSLAHGGSGVIRFSLPSEPLLPRWLRSFRQLLQKRYQF